MMKKIAIAAGFLFACLFGWSQNDPEVVIWECQGKIQYIASGETKPIKLRNGMVIPNSGTLKVKKNASVELLNGLKVVELKSAGQFELSNLFNESSASETKGMGGSFFAMVSNSLVTNPPPTSSGTKKGMGDNTLPPPTTSGTKKGMGSATTNPPPTSSGTKKGMGDKSNNVAPVFPLKGNLTPQTVTFSWLSDGTSPTKWAFQISQPQMLGPIVELETMETSVQQNLGSDSFKVGESYSWNVSAVGDPSREVANYEFKIESATKEAELLNPLKAAPEYQSANAIQKLLMEAHVMEQEGFVYRANELYDKAWKMDTKDLMVRKLYYSFWVRQL
ncbi:MAG: hypothetical protein IPJ74_06560 [Saprospiraceae bacterium]|nr:hypothetical protein [Saprospiraceae bacterium]